MLHYPGFSEVSPTSSPPGFAIGDPGSYLKHFPGYGACGIAVANLDNDPQNRPEIIVTTTNGELVVFRWNSSASPPLTPLHYEKLEGPVGMFNSIVIADLSGSDGLPEVYVSGGCGIRRFNVVQGAGTQ